MIAVTQHVGNVELQWGRAQLSAERRYISRQLAKMEELQWGRAQLSAESAAAEKDFVVLVSASMGPRSIERGEAKAVAPCVLWIDASMGPRSIERGEQLGGHGVACQPNELQWGRAQLSAESMSLSHAE